MSSEISLTLGQLWQGTTHLPNLMTRPSNHLINIEIVN
jgi:hypothetical protein